MIYYYYGTAATRVRAECSLEETLDPKILGQGHRKLALLGYDLVSILISLDLYLYLYLSWLNMFPRRTVQQYP